MKTTWYISLTDAEEDFQVKIPVRTYVRSEINQEGDDFELDASVDSFLPTFPSVEVSVPAPGSVSQGSDTSSRKAFRDTFDQSSSVSVPLRKKISIKTKHLRQKLSAKRAALVRMKKRMSNVAKKCSTSEVFDQLIASKTFEVQTFLKMQIFHQKRTEWTKKEKQLSLSIYYKSPTCYRFLRNIGFILPCLSTLRSWLKIYNLRTGVNTALVSKLKKKVASMTEKERECIVLCDEIRLKRGIEYNYFFDFLEGYADHGSVRREAQVADHGLVFYLRGLFSNWKIPFCFYASAGPTKGPLLADLIKEVLQKLFEIKLVPRAIVSDQGSNNRAAYSSLGGTKQTPFFFLNSKKIYFIFDVPHLIKSLRNNFSNTKLEFRVNGKTVNWKDVSNTFEIDQRSVSARSLLRITHKHIWPNTFEKMRVKYAVQVFSKSMSAAILTAHATGELNSITAVDTAIFVRKVNDIFDFLDARTIRDSNPLKRGLSVFKEQPTQALRDAIEYFGNLEILENGKTRSNIYCVGGFQWTIKAILLLWEDLKNSNWTYLLTSRLNQDPLENCFSVLRSRGGYNPQPTVKQFRQALQHNMFIKLQDPISSANCEKDDHELLELPSDTEEDDSRISNTDATTIFKNFDKSKEEHDELSSDEDDGTQKENLIDPRLSLESCSIFYIAGYLISYLMKKTGCNHCKMLLLDESLALNANGKDLLILHRDYGISNTEIVSLKKPKHRFYLCVDYLLKEFDKIFDICRKEYQITKQIKNHLLNRVKKLENNVMEMQCPEHQQFIIDHIIKIKLFRTLKWINQTYHSKERKLSTKPHRKIRILS